VVDHINLLIVSGCLERISIRYWEDGTPICTGSLRVDELGTQGTIFKTFIPFEPFGRAAEALGAQEGRQFLLCQRKVFWRKYTTKTGEEKNGLAMLVSKSSVLLSMAGATSGA
jgi:hypothetical protein